MSGPRRIELIGVPFNSSGTDNGVARAPAALRRAGIVGALEAVGLAVRDGGDVGLEPGGPVRDPATGIIAPAALGVMIGTVEDAVAASLQRGALPLVLGGDCPVLIGCLAAARGDRPPGLLFVDGHEDAWPAHQSTTGEAADMELGLLLALDPASLPADLRRAIPQLDPRAVTIVGARDGAELGEAGVLSIGDRVELIASDQIGSDASIVGAAVDRLASGGPWWFHVDLDVLATASLAAVDYRQPGGLDWATLTTIARRALTAPALIGWDVTIYNPDLDPDGSAARRIVAFIVDVLRPERARPR